MRLLPLDDLAQAHGSIRAELGDEVLAHHGPFGIAVDGDQRSARAGQGVRPDFDRALAVLTQPRQRGGLASERDGVAPLTGERRDLQ